MLRQLAALLALFQLALQSYAVGLLAIDYGSDSFKASYVGPGVPFDVLYNKDSKRKTPSIVTLHGSDVLVGGDASALVRLRSNLVSITRVRAFTTYALFSALS